MVSFPKSGHIANYESCSQGKLLALKEIWNIAIGNKDFVLFLNQAYDWFLEIAFVHEVGMLVCVSTPEAINYIHVILNLYNQLNKFVAFRNVTKLSMHGRGLCNEVRRDRNQSNEAILASQKSLVSR